MEALGHVLWIGGPPATGKTTIALRLARRYGLRWYSADAQTWAHRDRAIREGNPAARRWEAMTVEERWVTATPDEMLELSLHHERGRMLVEDLQALPEAPLIAAEGSIVPPSIVSTGIADSGRALWLIPSERFHQARLAEQELGAGPRGLYALLAEVIEREAREHRAPMLTVDGTLDVTAMTAAVEDRFAEALAAGPRADTPADRRALLREANEAVVGQVRDYYARPWADGDAESVVREFVCECGDTDCDAIVELEVRSAAAGPALAAGHGSSGGRAMLMA
jgi:hypothetical protein